MIQHRSFLQRPACPGFESVDVLQIGFLLGLNLAVFAVPQHLELLAQKYALADSLNLVERKLQSAADRLYFLVRRRSALWFLSVVAKQ